MEFHPSPSLALCLPLPFSCRNDSTQNFSNWLYLWLDVCIQFWVVSFLKKSMWLICLLIFIDGAYSVLFLPNWTLFFLSFRKVTCNMGYIVYNSYFNMLMLCHAIIVYSTKPFHLFDKWRECQNSNPPSEKKKSLLQLHKKNTIQSAMDVIMACFYFLVSSLFSLTIIWRFRQNHCNILAIYVWVF